MNKTERKCERSYVKGHDIIVSKTLINELFKFSNNIDDQTPNSVGFHDFSPIRQLTNNGLNLNVKLLHNLIAKSYIPKVLRRSWFLTTNSSSCGRLWKYFDLGNIMIQ